MLVHMQKDLSGKSLCGKRDVTIVDRKTFESESAQCQRCASWKPKTKAEGIIIRLVENGWEEVPCRAGKYRQFSYKDHDASFFVGKSGALRYGTSAGKSRSLTNNVDRVLETLKSRVRSIKC
jgi:hypothetical protein